MARITIAALQAQIEELNAAVVGLTETIDELRQDVAVRDARILRGHDVVRALRAEITVLHEQLEVKPRVVIRKVGAAAAGPQPVVTRFVRGGQLWEKTRVGNTATERLVEQPAEATA